jgi:hypothetical protein
MPTLTTRIAGREEFDEEKKGECNRSEAEDHTGSTLHQPINLKMSFAKIKLSTNGSSKISNSISV